MNQQLSIKKQNISIKDDIVEMNEQSLEGMDIQNKDEEREVEIDGLKNFCFQA